MITQWRQEVRVEEALPALWGRIQCTHIVREGGGERGGCSRPGHALVSRAFKGRLWRPTSYVITRA